MRCLFGVFDVIEDKVRMDGRTLVNKIVESRY
jgi:hypothetical protein